MERREFLKRTIAAGLTASVIPLRPLGRMPLQAYAADNPLLGGLQAVAKAAAATDRVLVLIQLKGGNDGLNTLVPFASQAYQDARPLLKVPENQVIRLTDTMGLGPDVAGLQPLWDNGKLSLIQQVGYANPNRSHFRGTDIWLTGSDADEIISTGWLARYLGTRFPEYDTVPPVDPVAIHIDPVLSLALNGNTGGFGIAMRDPQTFFSLVQSGNQYIDDTTPQTPGGFELRFVQRVNLDSIAYSQRVKEAADLAQNQVSYGNSSLEQQLSIVARLIAGGLQTPVYIVSQTGYDTHANQDTRHPALLQTFARAIATFQDDVEKLGVAGRVIGATFSEFGRRLNENGSKGTDHGAASVQLVFGEKVKPGVVGPDPDFTQLDNNGDTRFATDYRQLYTTLLAEWFGASQQQLSAVFPSTYTSLNIIEDVPTGISGPEHTGAVPQDFRLDQNYPNPFNAGTIIRFGIPRSGYVHVSVYNQLGQMVRVLTEGPMPAGTYQLHWDGRDSAGRPAPSGQYFYMLRAGGFRQSKSMTMVK